MLMDTKELQFQLTIDHKLKLSLIGKAKNPCPFKHVNDLSVWYRNKSNAWMAGTIFKDWF